ncbi:MAG: hypothetical protein GXP46_08270 [Deferribacteres bacterium]|nr:hypothetical protein [Deferribacteres bacterium]
MGVEYDYLSERYFSVEELLRIHETARRTLSGFDDFSTGSIGHAYFEPERLPLLHDLKGIRLIDISTEGYLTLKKEPWDDFRDILERGANTIGKIGLLLLRCGFEEKNSKQTKRGYDTVDVKVEKGKRYFGYSANGSRVTNDVQYRKTFMTQFISAINLPLSIEEKDNYFTLRHNLSGELRISRGGLRGENPSAFFCEMPGASNDELIERMKICMEKFASKKRFEYTWTARCSGIGSSELSRQIYDMVIESNFPAIRYFLDIEYSLDDIYGLEVLKGMCGPDDEVFAGFFSFTLPEDNHAEARIHATFQGYQLMLTMTDSAYLKLVEEKLGLKFREVR